MTTDPHADRFIPNPWLHETIPTTPPSALPLTDRTRIEAAISRNASQILRSGPNGTSDIYHGSAGLAFMFWKLANGGTDPLLGVGAEKTRCEDVAKGLAREALEGNEAEGGKHVGFICTSSGPLALGAILFPDRRSQYLAQLKAISQRALSSSEWSEVLYGRAGFLYTLLFLS
ncbi:hypothetical protein HK097_004521, partial [Rhizophlyctis rosea]